MIYNNKVSLNIELLLGMLTKLLHYKTRLDSKSLSLNKECNPRIRPKHKTGAVTQI